MSEQRVEAELSKEWCLTQVKLLEDSCRQALDGLTQMDEDFIDTWAAGIPTRVKLVLMVWTEEGGRANFLEEWKKVQAGIAPREGEMVRRNRILRKRQLVVDILDEVKVWMRVYVESEPDAAGAFMRGIAEGGDAGQVPQP
jgi:hypothetical protein